MVNLMSNRNTILILIFIACLAGWFGRGFYSSRFSGEDQSVIQLRENSNENKFINPLILVADNRQLGSEEYADLKAELDDYVDKKSNGTGIEKISVYFRDLNSGDWIGINEEEKYAPSSMLKVSTMMALLKLADRDSKVLLQKVYYEPTNISGQFYQPQQLTAGSYTTKELLQQMIIESDNDAMKALHKLYADELQQIYKDLDLPSFLSEDQDFMSPRFYSRFFRTFYNGSYISHFYSDEALELLTFTHFDGGLLGGVKSGTTVAHKFGEFTETLDGVVIKRELHDCGIVYYPERPYFICVMTEGQEFVVLEEVIRTISKITFDYMGRM